MGVFSSLETRSIWLIPGLGVLLGLALLVEVIAVGVTVLTSPPGYFVGVITTIISISVLLYGSFWISRSDLSPHRYGRIVFWVFGVTFAVLLLNIALIVWAFSPSDSIFVVVSWIRWAVSLGAAIGLIIGLFEARAISREVEAERIRTQKEELQEQRDKLEDFAGIVSHDLRNPLNVAEGRLELAQEECDSDNLDDVAAALERMGSLIDDILTLAREGKSVETTEPVDLAEICESCWRNVETPEATLAVKSTQVIQADASRLEQILENLIRNAVEHGGEDVTVTVGGLDDGFYVADDGPGLPGEKRDNVFEAGYSTSEGGTGFGLSIVKEIVEAHNWEIRVTEGGDGGARFEITGVEFIAE